MKWEYKTLVIQPMTAMTASDLTKELNKHGKDGWRLIQFFDQGTSFMAIFMRELKAQSAKDFLRNPPRQTTDHEQN